VANTPTDVSDNVAVTAILGRGGGGFGRGGGGFGRGGGGDLTGGGSLATTLGVVVTASSTDATDANCIFFCDGALFIF
jgi:hypothetical protein